MGNRVKSIGEAKGSEIINSFKNRKNGNQRQQSDGEIYVQVRDVES